MFATVTLGGRGYISLSLSPSLSLSSLSLSLHPFRSCFSSCGYGMCLHPISLLVFLVDISVADFTADPHKSCNLFTVRDECHAMTSQLTTTVHCDVTTNYNKLAVTSYRSHLSLPQRYTYGELESGDCLECQCDPAGSLSLDCHGTTGECYCARGHTGRRCDQCVEGWRRIKGTCAGNIL